MVLLDIAIFLGRLHPLIVHLPIGFLLLAALLHLLSRRKKQLEHAVPFILLLGFISAVLACIFGYLLSLTGTYDIDQLTPHKNSGIALAIFVGLLWLFQRRMPPKLFTALLACMVLLVSYSGHLGGSLTHGSDYLSLSGPRHPKDTSNVAVEDTTRPAQHINSDIPLTTNITKIDALRKEGWSIRVMLEHPPMLDVTLPEGSPQKNLKTDLAGLEKNIIWLNLSSNNLTDPDLTFLSQLSNLEKLRLENNPLTDDITTPLQNLHHLESINLNETKLTDKGLSNLKGNPSIKRIYTWKTRVKQP